MEVWGFHGTTVLLLRAYSAALQIKARAEAHFFAWLVHEFVCHGMVAGADAAGVLGRG